MCSMLSADAKEDLLLSRSVGFVTRRRTLSIFKEFLILGRSSMSAVVFIRLDGNLCVCKAGIACLREEI